MYWENKTSEENKMKKWSWLITWWGRKWPNAKTACSRGAGEQPPRKLEVYGVYIEPNRRSNSDWCMNNRLNVSGRDKVGKCCATNNFINLLVSGSVQKSTTYHSTEERNTATIRSLDNWRGLLGLFYLNNCNMTNSSHMRHHKYSPLNFPAYPSSALQNTLFSPWLPRFRSRFHFVFNLPLSPSQLS